MLIQNREQFNAAITVLNQAELIGVDTETTLTDKWDTKIVIGVGTYCEIPSQPGMYASFYFPFRHEIRATFIHEGQSNLPLAWLRELGSPLSDPNKVFVFHNAKFDITVLARDNIKVQGLFWDTMLMSHMLKEYEYKKLELCAKREFGIDSAAEKAIMKKIHKQMERWEAIPPVVMGKYCEMDAELTYRLFHVYKPRMDAEELTPLWRDEYEFCKILIAMEQQGVGLNIPRAETLAFRTRQRLIELQETLGYDPLKKNETAIRLFGNPPEGLGFVPGSLSGSRTKKFPKGIPIMDKAALKAYTHPEVDMILEYRGHAKAYSTWWQGFLNKVCADGRLHPEFRQGGTVTTRLSCADPNLQQIPRRPEEVEEEGITKDQVKSVFLAKPGYTLIEADYNQLEFRLGGVYSQDEAIIKGYENGADFHSITAQLLEIARQDAKTINFLIMYGGGAKKLAQQLGCSESKARGILKQYHEAYPGLYKASQRAEAVAAANGYVKFWTGRRRHFQWPSEFHKAFNSCIQGGAAEIVKHTMIKLKKELNTVAICQVHDALWFELPMEKADELMVPIQQIMEWPKETFDLAFPVDVHPLVPSLELV